MIEKASIDRFEGEWAILLVGDSARPISVPRTSLPTRSREGHWLCIELDDFDHLIAAAYDPAETRKARRRIARKLERLRRGDHLK
jgi:hypothetical protein